MLIAVHHRPGLSRADLTRMTGLNRSTVGALAAELVSLGLVHEVAPSEHVGRGRPSPHVYPRADVATLAVNPDTDAVTLGVIGLGGTVHMRERVPFSSPPTAAEVIDLAASHWSAISAEREDLRLIGAGLAIPGLVRAEDGVVVRAPHLDWTNEPFTARLTEAIKAPVVARNDARVATVAETVFGAGRGVSDLIYLNGAASGVGGGAVVDGSPLRGRDGFAGEVGHMVVPGGRELCHCGRRGCLETEVSLPPLLAMLGHDQVDLSELDDELARAAAQPRVRAEIQRQLSVLAGAIGDLVSLFNPELVVLGGFLGSLYATAPQALESAMRVDAFAPLVDRVRVERAQLGSRVHLVGAAEISFLPLLRDPAVYTETLPS